MEGLDRYLQEHFDLPPKNPPEEAQRRWRSAVGTIVKNRRRRFHMVPDLDRRQQDDAKRRSVQAHKPKYPIPITPTHNINTKTSNSSTSSARFQFQTNAATASRAATTPTE